MSDSPAGRWPGDDQTADSGHADEAPRRVIGTPPPGVSLLGDPAADAPSAPPRELPSDPADLPGAKRAERVVAVCFLIATLAGLAFIVAYFAFPVHSLVGVERSNLALGLSTGLVFLALAAGTTIWVRRLMPDVELTEDRKPLRSSEEDRAAFEQTFDEGADASQFVKRPLLRRTLIAAAVPATIAPIVLLADLGPLPRKDLTFTVWRPGVRLLKADANTPVTPGSFSSPGSMITVVPDGYQDNFDALAKAAVIIIKFAPLQVHYTSGDHPVPGKVVANWTVDNIVAYSKICTHVGCPAALYEQTTHHILCPCHQSTFDATRGAAVIFGPATRPLPQLPMTLDAQGFLVARHDFTEPVGPSYWERP
jgi:ubiquinol-cytochrome c reductase iron-sulfur subunit